MGVLSDIDIGGVPNRSCGMYPGSTVLVDLSAPKDLFVDVVAQPANYSFAEISREHSSQDLFLLRPAGVHQVWNRLLRTNAS